MPQQLTTGLFVFSALQLKLIHAHLWLFPCCSPCAALTRKVSFPGPILLQRKSSSSLPPPKSAWNWKWQRWVMRGTHPWQNPVLKYLKQSARSQKSFPVSPLTCSVLMLWSYLEVCVPRDHVMLLSAGKVICGLMLVIDTVEWSDLSSVLPNEVNFN